MEMFHSPQSKMCYTASIPNFPTINFTTFIIPKNNSTDNLPSPAMFMDMFNKNINTGLRYTEGGAETRTDHLVLLQTVFHVVGLITFITILLCCALTICCLCASIQCSVDRSTFDKKLKKKNELNIADGSEIFRIIRPNKDEHVDDQHDSP